MGLQLHTWKYGACWTTANKSILSVEHRQNFGIFGSVLSTLGMEDIFWFHRPCSYQDQPWRQFDRWAGTPTCQSPYDKITTGTLVLWSLKFRTSKNLTGKMVLLKQGVTSIPDKRGLDPVVLAVHKHSKYWIDPHTPSPICWCYQVVSADKTGGCCFEEMASRTWSGWQSGAFLSLDLA